jgi:hypothetical protein
MLSLRINMENLSVTDLFEHLGGTLFSREEQIDTICEELELDITIEKHREIAGESAEDENNLEYWMDEGDVPFFITVKSVHGDEQLYVNYLDVELNEYNDITPKVIHKMKNMFETHDNVRKIQEEFPEVTFTWQFMGN